MTEAEVEVVPALEIEAALGRVVAAAAVAEVVS